MNKEWSELNKLMQLQIKKKDTFTIGIDTLLSLRKQLMEQIMQFRNELSDEEFSVIPTSPFRYGIAHKSCSFFIPLKDNFKVSL